MPRLVPTPVKQGRNTRKYSWTEKPMWLLGRATHSATRPHPARTLIFSLSVAFDTSMKLAATLEESDRRKEVKAMVRWGSKASIQPSKKRALCRSRSSNKVRGSRCSDLSKIQWESEPPMEHMAKPESIKRTMPKWARRVLIASFLQRLWLKPQISSIGYSISQRGRKPLMHGALASSVPFASVCRTQRPPSLFIPSPGRILQYSS